MCFFFFFGLLAEPCELFISSPSSAFVVSGFCRGGKFFRKTNVSGVANIRQNCERSSGKFASLVRTLKVLESRALHKPQAGIFESWNQKKDLLEISQMEV